MPTSLGELVLRIRLDDRNYNRGLGDARREAARTGQQAGTQFTQGFAQGVQNQRGFLSSALDSVFQGIGVSIGLNLASAAGDAFTGAFRQVLEVGTTFQSTEALFFTALEGDAERAKELLQEVADFAATTTFSFREASQGSATLLLGGTDPDEIIDTLGRLGDVAAGAQRPLQQLLNVYRDVQVAGVLGGNDRIQIRPFIPADLLAQVETFEDLQRVIADLTNEGGRFFGATANQARTLNGIISNLGDSVDQIFLGIFRDATPLITEVLDLVKQVVEAIAPDSVNEGLFSELGERVQAVSDALNFNEQQVQSLANALSGGLESALDGVLGLIETFVTFLRENPTALEDAVRTTTAVIREMFEAATNLASILTDVFGIMENLSSATNDTGDSVDGLSSSLDGLDKLAQIARDMRQWTAEMREANQQLINMINYVNRLARGLINPIETANEIVGRVEERIRGPQPTAPPSGSDFGSAVGDLSALPAPEGANPFAHLDTTGNDPNVARPASAGGGGRAAGGRTRRQIEAFALNLVDLGKAFEAAGFRVREHPAFGGVTGGHAPNSFHHFGEAIDVTHHHGSFDDSIALTRRARNLLRPFSGGRGFNEVLGPGDPGHPTHLHLAARDNRVIATSGLLNALAGIGVSIPSSALTPTTVSPDFLDGLPAASRLVRAQETQAQRQQRIQDEARRRADEQVRRQQRLDLQDLDDSFNRELAEFDSNAASSPDGSRAGTSELRQQLVLRQRLQRELMQISQAQTNLEREGGRDEEIQFLERRKMLILETFELEEGTLAQQRERAIQQEEEKLRIEEERKRVAEERLNAERSQLEAGLRADVLDTTADLTGNEFEANELRRQADIIREIARAERELFDLRERFGEDSPAFEGLAAGIERLRDLNIEQINRDFQSLGRTVGRDVGDAFEGFARDIIRLENPVDALISLLDRLVNALLDVVFSQLNLGGLFGGLFGGGAPSLGGGLGSAVGGFFGGRDGATVPNFMNGGSLAQALRNESPYPGILGVFHSGEQILSDTTGEAARYRDLQSSLGPSPLSRVNGMGGTRFSVPISQNFSLSTGGGGPSESEMTAFAAAMEERMALVASAVFLEQFRGRGALRR